MKKNQNLKNRNHDRQRRNRNFKKRNFPTNRKNINRLIIYIMCTSVFPLNFNNEAIKRHWLNKNVENQIRSTFNEELLKRVIEAKLYEADKNNRAK